MELSKDNVIKDGVGTKLFVSDQRVYRFDNGYGASVISGEHAYSDIDHPYELAVIKFDGDGFDLVYDTPITSDVIGYLDANGVNEVLKQIKALKETDDGTEA